MKHLLRPKTIIVVLVLILTFEIAIRLLEGSLIDGTVGSLTSFLVLQEKRWTLQPKVTVVAPTRYGNIAYSVNAHGYRGSDIGMKPDSRKIVFLGDSITFGLGAEHAATFPMLIDRRLNHVNTTGREFEVANLAMFAYAPAHELETLKSVALNLKPEVVILQLYLNDFTPKAAAIAHASLQDTAFVLKEHVIISSAILRRARQAAQMALFVLFHDVRRNHFPATLGDDDPRELSEIFSHLSNDAMPGVEEIEEMNRICTGNGIRFAVMLSPNEVQLYNNQYDGINDRISAFCKDKNIPFHDPLPSMRSAENRTRFFLNGLHFSKAGHDWLASWLLPIVKTYITSDPMLGPQRTVSSSSQPPDTVQDMK